MSKENSESDSGVVSSEWDALLTGAIQGRMPETELKRGALDKKRMNTTNNHSWFVKGLASVFVAVVTLGLLLPSAYVGWLVFDAVGGGWWAFAAGHFAAILSGAISILVVAKILNWCFGKKKKGV